MESKQVLVPNIGCDGCVRAIQNEVSDIQGVKNVNGNVDDKQVVIEWDSPATWEQIEAAMTEIEYPPAQ